MVTNVQYSDQIAKWRPNFKMVTKSQNGRQISKWRLNFKMATKFHIDYFFVCNFGNALCSFPLVKMEIRDSSQISTTAPIFSGYNYFRQNIWRLASVQFHFWYIFWDKLITANCRWMIHNIISFNSSRLQGGCE